MSSAQPLVLEQVCKRFGSDVVAVADVSLQVPAGKLLGLLGPSGCGKTTLLRMIAGLIPVTSGRIILGETDVTHMPVHLRDIGLVFQQYALFPHLSVADNVAFGLRMRGLSAAVLGQRVREALEMVRLASLAARKPKELSGGQQQRVALARALVIQPRILLLDEPLSNLDAKLRDNMRDEITELQRRLGITTVFVTHDQTEALTMCDWVGVMSEGRLEQFGTPEEIYESPNSPFVAQFVGRSVLLEGHLDDAGSFRAGAEKYSCRPSGDFVGQATAVMRPHRITLSPARDSSLLTQDVNVISGSVRRLMYVGDVVVHEVDTQIGLIKVEHSTNARRPNFAQGDAVMCEWAPSDMLVFPRS